MVYGFGLAFFCVAWLLPGHYFPWHNFQQEVVAAIGALILGLSAVASVEVRRLPLPRLAIATFALAIVPAVQFLFGEVSFLADALLPSLYLCAFALTVVASMALTRAYGDQFVGSIFAAFLVAAGLSIGIGLVQWLQLGPLPMLENLPLGGRVYGNFTQPNHLAALLGMTIGAVAWLFEARRIGRWSAMFAVWFLELGLVMTQSRVGWLIASAFVLWWWIVHKRASLRSTWLGVVSGALIFVAMTLTWTSLNDALDLRVTTLLADRVQVIGGRSVHWPAMWDAVWRRPLWGWGWMQVGAAQQAVALDHPPSHEWITYSHNVFLDLLVWNGAVIGSLVIAGIAWWSASRSMRCRDAATWALMGSAGALGAYALVEFPHAYTFFLLPLGVLIGAVEANHNPDATDARSLPKWAFGVLIAVMASMLSWIFIEYLEVEEASRRASLAEARYVAPGQEPTVPNVHLLDNQRDFIWMRLTEAREGMSDADIDRMRRIDHRYMPPAVMLRFALAAGLNDRADEARLNLRLICQMWTSRNCEEGRQSWTLLQARFKRLRSIEFPPPSYVDNER